MVPWGPQQRSRSDQTGPQEAQIRQEPQMGSLRPNGVRNCQRQEAAQAENRAAVGTTEIGGSDFDPRVPPVQMGYQNDPHVTRNSSVPPTTRSGFWETNGARNSATQNRPQREKAARQGTTEIRGSNFNPRVPPVQIGHQNDPHVARN